MLPAHEPHARETNKVIMFKTHLGHQEYKSHGNDVLPALTQLAVSQPHCFVTSLRDLGVN